MRPLENLADIQQVASSLLQLADVDEQLPTPVGDVVAAAGLLEVDDYALSDGKISQAPRELRGLLRGAARKIRGALDRRERILHISPEIEIPAQRKFVECHEVMHDALPWRKDLLVLVDTQMFRVPPDLDGVHRLWPEGHNATRWTSLANPAPPESILLGSRNASEKEPTVSETVLPPLSPDSVTDKLPRDPSDLLTGDERHELDDDLAQLAQLRREAETASASLRLG